MLKLLKSTVIANTVFTRYYLRYQASTWGLGTHILQVRGSPVSHCLEASVLYNWLLGAPICLCIFYLKITIESAEVAKTVNWVPFTPFFTTVTFYTIIIGYQSWEIELNMYSYYSDLTSIMLIHIYGYMYTVACKLISCIVLGNHHCIKKG